MFLNDRWYSISKGHIVKKKKRLVCQMSSVLGGFVGVAAATGRFNQKEVTVTVIHISFMQVVFQNIHIYIYIKVQPFCSSGHGTLVHMHTCVIDICFSVHAVILHVLIQRPRDACNFLCEDKVQTHPLRSSCHGTFVHMHIFVVDICISVHAVILHIFIQRLRDVFFYCRLDFHTKYLSILLQIPAVYIHKALHIFTVHHSYHGYWTSIY